MKTVVTFLLRSLEADEREMLLGDIAELKLHEGQAIMELLGFLSRRWMMPLRDWRVSVAAVGFLWFACMPLLRLFSPALTMPFRFWYTYQRYGAIYETGLSVNQDLCIWTGQIALLGLFSWASGYTLALFVRRNFRTVALVVIVALMAWWIWLWMSLGRFPFLLLTYGPVLLAPAILGAYRYRRHGPLRTLPIALLVLTTFGLIAIQSWMAGWFEQAMLVSGGDISWLHTTTWYERLRPWLLVSLPGTFLLIECWVRCRKETT